MAVLARHSLRAGILLAGTLAVCLGGRAALAQDVGLNPDNLSFVEEPLAFELFGFTVNYNQLVDVPVVHDAKKSDTDVNPRSNVRIVLRRKLPNAITIGGSYFGSYDDREKDKYEDRWAVFARGVWGRGSVGEVNESVREATRRWRGTGNAELEFDDVVGTLKEDDFGGAYSLRISAYTLNIAVDEDGNSDIGVTYERPNKYVDIRLTGRLTNSELWSANRNVRFDTTAIGFVGQVEYGSWAADLGVGYEYFDAPQADGDRVYVSAGVHYKVRRLTLSAEGHLGTLDGNSERSAALGARYDIARGMSVNLGYNYAKTDADIDGIAIQSLDKSDFISSFRYEF